MTSAEILSDGFIPGMAVIPLLTAKVFTAPKTPVFCCPGWCSFWWRASPSSSGVLANNSCLTHQIPCDGICATVCDGFVDCSDKQDESEVRCKAIICSSAEDRVGDMNPENLGDTISGLEAKFKCAYGGCLERNLICNGHKDCWDGSDETSDLCATQTCSRRQFQCAYGACVRRVWKCNGKPHCVDNSDETAEVCRNNRCSSAKFQCDYGGCINKKLKCNGKVDCIDSSDESEKTCGPNHILTTTTTTTTPQTPPTGPPGTLLIPVGPPSDGGCTRDGLCACPSPYTHLCVPCDNTQACERIDEGVCNIETERETALRRVKVNVLVCGTQPVLDDTCGSAGKVPVLSLVSAECWGIITLMQCQADGMWHSYGTLHTHSVLPTSRLCQPQLVNSPGVTGD
ncbi:hypothetical protein Pmani_018840 [Petrolisthes manimaculis]|uniref:Uncharacterized protein n=1 Tax=Petrolisthes manimaculis TaxID=1843537 RepID=A0AAE1U7Z0_9EUCA|nr:hypothetical protein Pmani_018840 [Petrolisthes manimaculis]